MAIRMWKNLQERLDLMRATRSIAEGHRKPFAVSINDGELVYGEWYEVTDHDDVTFFSGNRTPTLLREWYVDVEQPVWSDGELVNVRIGEVDAQPYEGKAHVVAINQSSSGWVSTLRGVGDVVARRD